MKRNFSNFAKLLSLVLMLGLIFAPALAVAASTVIKFAHVDPEDVFHSKKGAAARAFKDIVEAETAGEITVNLFPAGQLGGERDPREPGLGRRAGGAGSRHRGSRRRQDARRKNRHAARDR